MIKVTSILIVLALTCTYFVQPSVALQTKAGTGWHNNLPGRVLNSAESFDFYMNKPEYKEGTCFVEVFMTHCPKCKNYW